MQVVSYLAGESHFLLAHRGKLVALPFMFLTPSAVGISLCVDTVDMIIDVFAESIQAA